MYKRQISQLEKEVALRYLKTLAVTTLISLAIIFGAQVETPIWLIVWGVGPFLLGLWIASKSSEFKHTNSFIGVNGFAEFSCEGNRENISKSFEVNFNNLTDLMRVTEVRKQNFNYVGTAFGFVWLNNGKIVREVNDMHNSKEGNPTNDPRDYAAGGAILPVGADQGHKGYGLSFMVEMFSGLLTGLGFGIDPQARHNDGVFISVYKVENFRDLADFKREMKEFAEFVKTSPPATGFSEVLYPGELEARTEATRRKDGIFVEEETWEQITELMRELNVLDVVGKP